jgi:hypothetical protein
MYVDPSRVQQLARYSARAAEGSSEALAALEGEVRLFIEVLWSEADTEARERFMEAVRKVGPPMPWAAVMVPPPSTDGSQVRAPAAVELLLGQADPDDEGVPAYRLDPESAAGRRVRELLLGWQAAGLTASATTAGWRVELEDTIERDDDQPAREPGDVPRPAPPRAHWWKYATAGLGLVAVVGFALKTEPSA